MPPIYHPSHSIEQLGCCEQRLSQDKPVHHEDHHHENSHQMTAKFSA